MIVGRIPLRRLKDDTADLHRSAERHVRILDADATLAEYRRYLAAMFGWHAPLEERFAAHHELHAVGFDVAARRKAPLLAADLAAIGVEPSALPRCPSLPAANTLAGALGVAYVLEGATLGGRFILAKLSPRLAALRGKATAFLAGYGPATGAHWRSFGAIVERAITTQADEDEAVAGARETFARLIDWLAAHEADGGLREAS